MKKLYLCLFFSFGFLYDSFAQSAINPVTGGGFDAGSTFAANGWTVVNSSANEWVVGATTFYSAPNSAYISIDGNPANYSYDNTTAHISHFYQVVTLPANAFNVELSFELKGNFEDDEDGNLLDGLEVYTDANITDIPVADQVPGSPSAIQQFVQDSYNIDYIGESRNLDYYAGQTFLVIFTWINSGDSISGQPPSSVDAAALTFCIKGSNYSVTGGGAFCTGSSGVGVGLAASDTGINYQLYNNGNPVGSLVKGTGSPLDFGPQNVVGNYTVIGTSACNYNYTMTGSVSVTENPLPTATAGSNAPLCLGSTLNLTSGGGTTYSWTGPNGFTSTLQNPSISNFTSADVGIYTVSVTDNSCSAPATTNVTVTAGGITGGSISSASICSGGSGLLLLSGNSNSPIGWEYSTNSGVTWTNIANTTTMQNYSGITVPTLYRAVVSNGCSNAYSDTATISIHNYWTGGTNTNWNTASNWSDNLMPSTSCADVYIPGGTPNQPTLSAGTATITNLHILAGATLTVTGADLQIGGTISNAGIFLASGGTITLNGTTAQTVPAAAFQNNAVDNLIISNAAGVSLAGEVDVYQSLTYGISGGVLNTGGNLVIKSTATQTAWVGNLTGETITGNVTVERYIGAIHKWQLLAVPTQTAQTIHQAWQDGDAPGTATPTGFGTNITGPAGGTGYDFTSPGYSMKYWSQALDTFEGVNNTNILFPNKDDGYFIFIRGDRQATASVASPLSYTVMRTTGPLNVGNYPISVPANTNSASVGNPYASAVTFANIGNVSALGTTYYAWDPLLTGTEGVGGYQTLSQANNYKPTAPGTAYFAVGTSYPDIQSGQAFYVENGATPVTLTFNEAAKVSGLVTAQGTGSATIYYTVSNICGASSSSFTVSVNPNATAGTITGPTTVCAGSSILLSTNGNSGGTWLSTSPDATVNSLGFVTGVSAGSATIFYLVSNSCGSGFTSYNVTVNPGASAGTITGSSSTCQNTTTQLFTSGTSGGTWSSSNPAVAFVNGSTGNVLGLSPGTVTITYTVSGNSCSSGSVANFTFTVSPAGNAGTITAPSPNVCVGSSVLLSSNGTGGGTWLSGSPAATVNSFGLVTGAAPGSATIYYFVSNTCGSSFATFVVNVSPAANAGTLSGPSSVCAGATINLISSGTSGGTWTSSNSSGAFVDGSGDVVGIIPGNYTITYTVTSACATSTTSTTITVNPLPNAGSISGASSVCTGLSTTFTSTSTGGTWSSSNPAAASVNSLSGVVTAVATGSAAITYTVTNGCGTASTSASITVNPVLNAGTISGGSSVCVGSTLNLSSNGNSGGSWTSSNTGVATIDPISGVVTTVAAGNSTITYTVSNSCGTSTATQLVTVNAVANAGSVSGAISVCAGISTPFTDNGTGGGTWSSSNSSVATVNVTSGLVTGVAAGNAMITYTVTTGCGTASASATIAVNPLASAGTISGPTAVCVGATSISLSSNISGGTWSSSAPTIASINSSGQVSGLVAGTATITYSVSNTCGANVASYSVTVNPVPHAGNANGVGGQGSVCVASTFFMTVTGGDVGGTWKSSRPAVATVDPSTGEVTGVSAGNATITYNVTNSCGSSSSGMVVFVNSLPNAGTISGLSAVCAGSTINLSSSGDANGAWSSTTPNVATVNPTTGVVTGVAQGSTTIIYTVGSASVCGTSTATQLITVNPLANAGTISGNTTVCNGLSTTLTSNGTVGGTWSSSNSAIASVNSISGVVTAVAAGSATINYTVTSNSCGSTTASTTVTVDPVPNAGAISGASTVCVGSAINLSSNITGGTWSSSTSAVATIDPNLGVVTAIAAGNTTITYTVITGCGTASTTYALTVNPIPNAGTLSGTTYLCTGSTTTLSSNINGGTWSSSNTSAATVNSTTGLVTGLTAGSTTITYTISSGCGTATVSVVVTIGDSPAAGTVSGASALCVSSTAIFTSTGTGGGSWLSNNPAAATVDATTGVVTGVAAGSATISYTVSSTCGSSVSSANITISALPNAGSVSGSSAICEGSITTFTSNGTGGGSWSSNNDLVATINPTTGVVTGVAAGSATITYTVTNTCGTVTATANVTVNALPNSGTVSGASTLCVGSTTAFISTGAGGGSWSSNNTSAATVDPVTGSITGVAAGSATISYTVNSGTCGSSTSSANITINPLPNPGSITGSSTVCAGSTTGFASSGSAGGSWTSNNTAVATVDATTGVVTGVTAGSTTITYTVTNGCGTAGATQIITVNPLANAGTVSGASTVCVSSTTTYTSNGLSGGVWSSNNTSVATVDPASGLVTGLLPGNATITYTVTTPCGTAANSATITVIILPNAGTVSGSSTVCVGSTTTYTSDGLSGGTWSSATPSVATVDPVTGVVTGVSAGNATITYTFSNSCGTNSATQIITVNSISNAGTVSGAATVCIGAQATFTSNGLSGGTWSSSNTAAATVNSTTGVVMGVAAGSVTITYTSTTPCGGTTTSSANITVVAIPNAGAVSGNITVCVGATTTYASSGMSGGTWSSITPSVATVDPLTGVVTGVSAGNATIIYTFTNSCGTNSASQMITVNPLPNAGTVSGAATVCAGSQATFTSNGLSGGAWSSTNTAAATVNSTTGVVVGVAAGNATITYTSTTPCGTATASANITVNPVVSAGIVSGASTLCIGSTTPYTSSGSTGGTWSSVTPSVATVNATTGVVTGVSTGNATITYTVIGCGTSSASKLIAVSLAANPGTISGPSSICSGTFAIFTRSGGSNGGTWSSSNTAVATVNSSGGVTGVGAGTAVISYSVTGGCGTNSATASITVGAKLTITATNINASTDLNVCSASVALGSNVTITGTPTTLQYRIGFFPFFSFQITPTYTFYRGTTPVIVIASNSCGTVARFFLVTVVDNQPPTITCVPNATRTAEGNSSRYSVRGHEFDATASDNCGLASLVYSLSGATVDGFERDNTSLSGVRLNIGTTTITWKATDVNGNVSTCSTEITVTGDDDDHRDSFGKLSTLGSVLTVKVAPNPTSNYFTFGLQSASNSKVRVTIYDILGRVVEQVPEVPANTSLQLGNQYHFGVYFAEFIQDDQRVVLKLIKGQP